MNPSIARAAGIAAVAASAATVVIAPLHALARFATEDGASDLASPVVAAWARPAREIAGGLLTFSDPDTVYTTYGKYWLIFMVAVLACALAMRARRPVPMRRAERWGWRIALAGYGLIAAGSLVSYWTPYVNAGFAALTLPGQLLSTIGNTLLGVALLRAHARPRLTGWLLALDLPLSILFTTVGSMATGVLPFALAWGAAGWRLSRTQAAGVPAAVTPAARAS
jgi:hypothetical protein